MLLKINILKVRYYLQNIELLVRLTTARRYRSVIVDEAVLPVRGRGSSFPRLSKPLGVSDSGVNPVGVIDSSVELLFF